MKKIFVAIIAVFLSLGMNAQGTSNSNSDTSDVAPIVPSHLKGARKATKVEKEYARHLAEERDQQQAVASSSQFNEYDNSEAYNDMYYPYWNYGFGGDSWRLHKGLNVNLSASVFANLGHGYSHGAGFTQDVSLMYVTDLSPKAALAVGGYINNVTYRGSNYTTAGITTIGVPTSLFRRLSIRATSTLGSSAMAVTMAMLPDFHQCIMVLDIHHILATATVWQHESLWIGLVVVLHISGVSTNKTRFL